MKINNLNPAIFTVLLLISCQTKANVTQTFTPGSFTEVEVEGVFDIYLHQGNEEKIVVTTSQAVLDRMELELEGKQLSIDFKVPKSFDWPKKSEMHIYFKELTACEFEGVGNTKSEGIIKGKSLNIEKEGVGDLDLKLDYGSISIDSEGVGNTSLSGRCLQFIIDNQGVGSVDALGLEADTVEVKNQGVGSVKVWAKEEISIENQGVGSVKYKGDPRVKKLDSQGVGSVKKLD